MNDGNRNNGKYITIRACDLRHKETDRRLDVLEKAMKYATHITIGIFVGAVLNLIGVIGLLIAQYGGG